MFPPARCSKAFTLLELIVVIVILGILAAIAIPTFQKVIVRSQDSATETSVAALLREAQALAAFENREVTAADIEAASADLTIQTLHAGAYAAGTVTAWEDGKLGAPTLATRTDLLYKIDGNVAGVSLASASGNCIFGRVAGAASGAETWVGSASSCTGTSAVAGPGGETAAAPAPAPAPAPTVVYSTGALDTTFGTDGKVVTPIGSGNDYIANSAFQGDGKIVTAGSSHNGTNNDFVLARYNVDGSLDTTLGTSGKVVTPIGAGEDYASSVAVQGDGKLVVAGYSHNGTNYDFALVRYNADGSLDSTFGTGGKVVTPVGTGDDAAEALAVQGDGKLVVAGRSPNDFTLVRYNVDGSLDSTFGTGGKVVTPIGANSDYVSSVAVQGDGKIVAAGHSHNGTNWDFAVARYNVDGSLDNTFDGDGKVVTPIGTGTDYAHEVVVQGDGKPVVAGTSHNGTNDDFALVRYNVDGSLDSTFGTSGKVLTPVGAGSDGANSVVLQGDGKLAAAGTSHNGTNIDFALVRYNVDGSLDTTFDTDGKVVTPIGTGNDIVTSVLLQGDGKLVAAGYSHNGTDNDFALARYK